MVFHRHRLMFSWYSYSYVEPQSYGTHTVTDCSVNQTLKLNSLVSSKKIFKRVRGYQVFLNYITLASARGGHSKRTLCNRGQERGQAVKAEKLEGQAVKGTSQIRKSQGSSKLTGYQISSKHDTTSCRTKHYLSGGQGPKFKVKIFDRGRGC